MNDSKQAMEAFQAAQGLPFTAVVAAESDEGEEIILAFGTQGLLFVSDEDNDTLSVKFAELQDIDDAEDLTADPVWSRFIGKEFSAGWLTINQHGVTDGALLSFDEVFPQVALNVVASGFEFLEIRQRER